MGEKEWNKIILNKNLMDRHDLYKNTYCEGNGIQAFHFSLKTPCPPSMFLFDIKCLVLHHSPNNTDSGEEG